MNNLYTTTEPMRDRKDQIDYHKVMRRDKPALYALVVRPWKNIWLLSLLQNQQFVAAAELYTGLPDQPFFCTHLGTPVLVQEAFYPFRHQIHQVHPI